MLTREQRATAKSKLGNRYAFRDNRPVYGNEPEDVLPGAMTAEMTIDRNGLDIDVVVCGTPVPGERPTWDSPGAEAYVEDVAAAYCREGKGWTLVALSRNDERRIEQRIFDQARDSDDYLRTTRSGRRVMRWY